MRYGLVGDVAEPGPQLLKLLGAALTPLSFESALAELAAGHLDAAALAVPIPAEHPVRLPPGAEASGYVDTLTREGGVLIGRATLAEGLVAALRSTSWGVADRPVVLLGAAVRARAVAAALLIEGAQHVRFAARSLGQAIDATRLLQPLAHAQGALLDVVPLGSIPWDEGWERALVINATPVGLDDLEADPLWRHARLGREMRVVDLVHRPVRTALLRRAHRSKGQYLAGMAVYAEQALRRAALARGVEVEPELAERVRQAPPLPLV